MVSRLTESWKSTDFSKDAGTKQIGQHLGSAEPLGVFKWVSAKCFCSLHDPCWAPADPFQARNDPVMRVRVTSKTRAGILLVANKATAALFCYMERPHRLYKRAHKHAVVKLVHSVARACRQSDHSQIWLTVSRSILLDIDDGVLSLIWLERWHWWWRALFESLVGREVSIWSHITILQ